MVSISDTGGTVATYQYDGSNRRIVKVTTAISETRHFYWTNSWQDGEERVGSSTSMDKQFVWGTRYIDELVCRDDATPQRLYATQDANFNLTALVSTSGAVQQRFLYDPYGSSAVLTSSWDSTTDAYEWSTRFTGQFLDTESQVYLYRARYHNPNLGCFLNRDPLEYKGGSNLYSYVNSNPISRVDPNGMQNQNCCWEGTHCCGPDITANLLAMAADVQKQWDNASFFERSRLAIGTIGPEALAAWDIQNLVQGNVQNQNCGGGQASCQNSVTVNGKCYPQTAVNYWIAGLIFAAFDSSWLFRDDAKAFEALLYLYTNAPLGWEYGQQKRI
jgi:RHS repeat-associated protein